MVNMLVVQGKSMFSGNEVEGRKKGGNRILTHVHNSS